MERLWREGGEAVEDSSSERDVGVVGFGEDGGILSWMEMEMEMEMGKGGGSWLLCWGKKRSDIYTGGS